VYRDSLPLGPEGLTQLGQEELIKYCFERNWKAKTKEDYKNRSDCACATQ